MPKTWHTIYVPPRFRCDPFARDVAFDPGRASAPRITVPHMFAFGGVKPSAPAMSNLSWLNPAPHAIAVYASLPPSPVATQHSLPSGRCSLLGPALHRLDRASFARRTHSITSSANNCIEFGMGLFNNFSRQRCGRQNRRSVIKSRGTLQNRNEPAIKSPHWREKQNTEARTCWLASRRW